MPKTYTVVSTIEHTVTVVLDESDVRHAEMDSAVTSALRNAGIYEWDDWRFSGEAPNVVDMRPEPPGDCWFEADGHKWASNGVILIRDDASRPDGMVYGRPWRTDITGEMTARFRDGLVCDEHGSAFDARYAPVLRGGISEQTTDSATVRNDAGEVIAVVMRLKRPEVCDVIPAICDYLGNIIETTGA